MIDVVSFYGYISYCNGSAASEVLGLLSQCVISFRVGLKFHLKTKCCHDQRVIIITRAGEFIFETPQISLRGCHRIADGL